jgi:dTDP-4-dehydrorhamnose reductase
MDNRKILILGAQGQLGREFEVVLKKRGFNYTAPKEEKCNITDLAQLDETISAASPDIIINCAAYNAVDEAEEKSDVAYSVNSEAVSNIAKICKERDIFLVHYSSDYVFGGEKQELYAEEDEPDPINVYGRSKLQGEERIREVLDDYLIFRLSWLIGKGTQNFLYKLSIWASKNKVLKIAADEVSVPTFIADVIDITLLSLEKGLKGLYHLTSSGYTSRYELAKYYVQKMKLDNSVTPVSMRDFKTMAKRPGFSAMSNKKLSNALNVSIPAWEDGVIKYVLGADVA